MPPCLHPSLFYSPGTKSLQRDSLGIPLQAMVYTRFARVGESEKVLRYNKCEYCVCVCVCVFKVVIFWETTKEKALKDAEKFVLFCPSLCRYVNTFCFTGAKVENKIGMGKQTEEISRRRNVQYSMFSPYCRCAR